MTEFPSAFHDRSEHLVVVAPCEENLAGVELKKRAADGPDIDAEIVGHAENCLGC